MRASVQVKGCCIVVISFQATSVGLSFSFQFGATVAADARLGMISKWTLGESSSHFFILFDEQGNLSLPVLPLLFWWKRHALTSCRELVDTLKDRVCVHIRRDKAAVTLRSKREFHTGMFWSGSK